MKTFIFISIILFLTPLSCSKKEYLKQNAVGDNKYASGFKIETTKYGYNVEVFSSWVGNSGQKFNYILKRELVKNNIDSLSVQTLRIPLKKVAIMSTSHLAMIEAIGHVSAITGISEKQYVNSEKFWQHQSSTDVTQIGYENSLDIETLIKLKPDAIFLYGLSSVIMPVAEQIANLGIPVIFVSEFNELSPLAKLEWVRFFGCFFDCLPLADSIVNYKAENYNRIKNIAANVSIRPVVLSGLPWKDYWNIPGANTATATYIKDAGASYIFSHLDKKINYSLGIEEVFMTASIADYWINVGFAENINYIYSIDKRFMMFNAIKKQKVYNNNKIRNKAGGNDYMESGIMNPELILSDLISIFHPDLMHEYDTKYYHKIE